MEPLIPQIDENIPLPKNAAESLPELSTADELTMVAKTIVEISDLTGIPISPDKQDHAKARDIARKMVNDPLTRPDYALLRMETSAILKGMVQVYNFQLVDDLSELKVFVVNKLFEVANKTEDPKIRLQALTKLGEIDGIDAFKKRSEITHVIKPIEEVEKELLSVLEGIEYRVIEDKPVGVA